MYKHLGIQEGQKNMPKKWLLMFLGWFLAILGIAGLFLPFLPRLLFIGVGVGLLSPESTRVRYVWRNKGGIPHLQGKEKGSVDLGRAVGPWQMRELSSAPTRPWRKGSCGFRD